MRFILVHYLVCAVMLVGIGTAQDEHEEVEFGDTVETANRTKATNESVTTKPFLSETLVDDAKTETVGSSEVELIMSSKKESNLGNFLTDAMVYAFKNVTQLAILQSKSVNSRISKGNITSELIRNIFDVGVTFSLVKISGEDLRTYFEESVANFDADGNDGSGEFLQVSGFLLEFDIRQDVGKRLTSSVLHCYDCEEMKSVEDSDIYTVVVTSDMLINATTLTHKKVVPSILEFFQTFPDKTIPSKQYKKTQCRTFLMTKYYKDREYLIYFLLTVMSLSGFLTIISNSTVIYVGLKTSKKVFEKPILSLACVDILTGIICTPSVCLIYYYKYVGCEDDLKKYLKSVAPAIYNYKWILPNFVKACTCYHVLYITSTRFLRLYSVSFKVSRFQENVNVFLIYLCSMLFCLITMFVEQDKKWCDRIWPNVEVWITIILPIIVTIILDCFIFSIANRHFRRGDPKSKSRIKNVQAAKTTALMVGALLICYLPLMVKWHMCGLNSPVFSLVSQTLVATNSFMNPFIYAMKVPAFRSTLKGYIGRVDPEYSNSAISLEDKRSTRLLSYSTQQTGRQSLSESALPLRVM
eukprot:GFUD01036836.1.p1 GENE.GFUD01036836.1~~GFUD01036836.1.p1  ORF type:complete len:583 (-),score=130.25 GFUD01036836.1:172-1920(-)